MRSFLAILLLTAALALASGLSSSLAPIVTAWAAGSEIEPDGFFSTTATPRNSKLPQLAIGPEIEPNGRGPADLEQATAAELEVAIGPQIEPNGRDLA